MPSSLHICKCELPVLDLQDLKSTLSIALIASSILVFSQIAMVTEVSIIGFHSTSSNSHGNNE